MLFAQDHRATFPGSVIMHTRQLMTACLLAVAACGISSAPACAQQAVIQQPTVGMISGSTTVSVPDRGRTVLGSVGRGAASRSTYGPVPVGTNTGRSFEGSSLSVHAWIHDFEELDRQALAAAESSDRRESGRRLNDRADWAYRSLKNRERLDSLTNSGAVARGASQLQASAQLQASDGAEADRGLSAEQLFERGRKAEAAGRPGVALAFYRQARERGSHAAAREVERLQKSRR
jgi:hypothetical protein